MKTFLMIFTGIALKHEKVGPAFSSFNPFPSLASVETDDMTQIRCLSVALNNKPRPLLLLYYYMRNFCNLIGLEHWYFSLI